MSKEYKIEENRKDKEKIDEIVQNLPRCMKGFFSFMLTKNLSVRTVLGYARDLNTFCFYLQKRNPLVKSVQDITESFLDRLELQDIEDYMSFLTTYTKNGRSLMNGPSARARKLASLRSYWKWATSRKILKNNPTINMDMPEINRKNVVALEPEESRLLIQAARTGSTLTEKQKKQSQGLAARDAAILAVALGTGIRVSELVGINLDDLNFKDNSISIVRKGGDESKVYFSEEVKKYLVEYIETERDSNSDSTALFLSRKGGRLGVRGVQYMVRKYTDSALERTEHISAHKLRSSYGSAIYRETGDIYLTSRSLGHRGLEVTKRYADVSDDQRKEAAGYAGKLISVNKPQT